MEKLMQQRPFELEKNVNMMSELEKCDTYLKPMKLAKIKNSYEVYKQFGGVTMPHSVIDKKDREYQKSEQLRA